LSRLSYIYQQQQSLKLKLIFQAHPLFVSILVIGADTGVYHKRAAPEGLAVVLPVNVLGFAESKIGTSEGTHQVVLHRTAQGNEKRKTTFPYAIQK
jgi:hypothetical protein